MADPTQTDIASGQAKSGLFKRFEKGATLNNMNLMHDLNIVYDILEFLRGGGHIVLRKNDPKAWLIDDSQVSAGASPADDVDDWEEETLNIVTDAGVITRTLTVKTSTKADVETWDSTDTRLLLQVDDNGKLTADRGYFKT